MGVMQPKTDQESPRAGRNKEWVSLRSFRGNEERLPTLWFWTLDPRTVRDSIFVLLSHSICGILLQ